jgi:hypothetical protein
MNGIIIRSSFILHNSSFHCGGCRLVNLILPKIESEALTQNYGRF